MSPSDSNTSDDFCPETPLLAGLDSLYTALVRPDLLYVEYDRSRDEMVAKGNAGKILREALERTPSPDATSGEVFGSVPQWVKEFAAVEAHERDHIRRLLSTSFGLLCHAFRVQQAVAARELVIEAGSGDGEIKLPFNLRTSNLKEGSPAYRAKVASQLQTALEDRIGIADFRSAESALAGWTKDGCEYVGMELAGNLTHSTLQIQNAGNLPSANWLTSRHLLEVFGVCEEGNRLLGTGSGVEQVSKRLLQPDRWYTLPLLIWLTQFPSSSKEPRAIRPPRKGEITLSFYRNFPIEFFVALDLALWPPFSPDGLTSTAAEISWTDVSPAFRYARILLAYKKLGITPGEWPEDDLNVIIPKLQNRVCKSYGWPTPSELAKQWTEHLTAQSNKWFPDSVLGGFRHSTTLQLLKLRLDRPGDVVVNNLDYQLLKVGRSAGWITQESESLMRPITLAADADRQATEFWFHLYSLTPALLGTRYDRLALLKKYPVETQQACIETFDIWGSSLDGWPSEKFRLATAAFLDLP